VQESVSKDCIIAGKWELLWLSAAVIINHHHDAFQPKRKADVSDGDVAILAYLPQYRWHDSCLV